MDLSEASSPLLNEYKINYLFQIIPQTFLGGLRLRFLFKPPWFVYGIQIFLWSFPFILGSLFTLIVSFSETADSEILAMVCGLLIFISTILFNIIFLKSKQKLDGVKKVRNNFLMEEDEIEFTSCFSLDTLEFVIPKKKFIFNYFMHPLLCGLTCGFSLLFLLPRETELYFSGKAGSIVYYFLGWFIVCIGSYPLIGQSPKEPNTFRFNDKFELSSFTRVSYILMITISSYMLSKFGTFTDVHLLLYIAFLFFPILWLFGFLPSIDVLLSWSAEQILVHMMGGSPMATDSRLIIVFIVSWIWTIILYFISNKLAMITISAASSVLLSSDFSSIVIKLIHKAHRRPKILKQQRDVQCFSFRYSKIEFFILFFTVFVSGTIAGLVGHFTSINKLEIQDIFGCVLIVILFTSELLKNMQQLFIFWDCFRNPFYCFFHDNKMVRNIITRISFILTACVLPLFLVTFITFITDVGNLYNTFINVLFVFRLYRQIWQNTMRCSYDIALYTIIHWLKFSNKTWLQLTTPLQIFILSIISFWCKSFLKKCWFIILLIYNSKKLKDNQQKVNWSIITSFCFLPILIAIISISTLLSSPLLPLFTLPIFIVGFPRPLRMWPNVDIPGKSSSSDWVCYQQLTPAFVEELKIHFNYSTLHTPQAGTYFLARFQDRLIWVSVLESGFLYYNVVVKGLELQETSCHTTEAESIDELFSLDPTVKSAKFNQYITHTIIPKVFLKLKVYSDAKNVLTGIIDNPECLKTISENFPKVLLWILLRYSQHRRLMGLEDKHDHISSVDDDRFIQLQNNSTAMTNITIFSEDSLGTSDTAIFPEAGFSSGQTFRNDRIKPVNTCLHKVDKDTDCDDDEFGDFGFGESELSINNNSTDDETSLGDPSTAYNTINHIPGGDSKILDPPSHWLSSLPYNEADLMSVYNIITTNWYQLLIRSICDDAQDLEKVLQDLKLAHSYKQLIMNCYNLIEKVGVVENSSIKEGPGHVIRMFEGRLPWSPHISWIDNDKNLKELVVKAYRLTFKLVYDSILLGDSLDDEEMLHSLEECEQNWFLGQENDVRWMDSILEEIPNLFSIAKCEKNGTYTSRMLTLQTLSVPIATLNEECVRGIWSALSLELYYMTNDDEERYSIQALPQVLRNIVTQAADPPLGYPVYSSGLIRIPSF